MANAFVSSLYFIIPVILAFIVETLICFRGLKSFYAINPVKWLPPGWVFGVAWIVLFVLMAWGGSLYYIKQTDDTKKYNFLAIFYIQLLLNFLWVLIFFGSPSKEAGRFALMILLFLFIAVVWLAVLAWPVSITASAFFIVYAAWLVFAAVLNVAFIVTDPCVDMTPETEVIISEKKIERGKGSITFEKDEIYTKRTLKSSV